MISFKESMRLLDSLEIEPLESLNTPLMDSLGYFLAEDIVATYNSPEFPTSAMDGYAVRFDELKEGGELEIQSINKAGADSVEELEPKKAIKTFTGSLMPKGSDTLIPIELVEVNDGKITIKEMVERGFSVRAVGESFKKGEPLIKKGRKLDFEEIALLSSLNRVEVKVYRAPKVGIVATGDELLELGQEQTRPTQIRSSNNYTIEAIVKKFGGNPINYGCYGDDIETLKDIFKKALKESDIVVSTGGVSVGDFDFVKDVIRDLLGAEVVFKGVVIKPGQHIMLAKKGNKTILALPGFAYSSTVTSLLYLVPLLYRYQGSKYKAPIVKARLLEEFKKRSRKTEFTPANLSIIDGELAVDFKDKKDGTSAIMTNMLGDTVLVVSEPDEGSKSKGEYVNIFIYNLTFKGEKNE
jgi:molybdopterin molybdotransferase